MDGFFHTAGTSRAVVRSEAGYVNQPSDRGSWGPRGGQTRSTPRPGCILATAGVKGLPLASLPPPMFSSCHHGQGRHSWQGHPVLTMSAQLHPAPRPGCHHSQLPRHPGWASGHLCVPEPSPPLQPWLWFFMPSACYLCLCHIFKDSAPATPCPPAQSQAGSLAAPPRAVTPPPLHSLTVATRSPCPSSRPKGQCPVLSVPSQWPRGGPRRPMPSDHE